MSRKRLVQETSLMRTSVRRAKRMDRAQVSISGRMDKQIVEHLYNGKLL